MNCRELDQLGERLSRRKFHKEWQSCAGTNVGVAFLPEFITKRLQCVAVSNVLEHSPTVPLCA